MKKCKNCQNDVELNATICPLCNTELEISSNSSNTNLRVKKILFNVLAIMIMLFGSFLLFCSIAGFTSSNSISILFLVISIMIYALSYFVFRISYKNSKKPLWFMICISFSILLPIIMGFFGNNLNENYLKSKYPKIDDFVNTAYKELDYDDYADLKLIGLEQKKYSDSYYNVVSYLDKFHNKLEFKFDSNNDFESVIITYEYKNDFTVLGLSLLRLSAFDFSISDKSVLTDIIMNNVETKGTKVWKYTVINFPSLGYFVITTKS